MKESFKVTSPNGEYQLSFDSPKGEKGELNGEKYELDIVETSTGYHVLRNGLGYDIDVISVDRTTKTVELRIDAKHYVFQVKDKYDDLLEKLGMDRSSAGKVDEIKAPMPGLVLDIMAEAGDEVKVDQPLFILEAMKMENVIKSPGDSVIKKIEVTKGDSVEKNQILVTFS
jgi:biotin carboxyl carrier protein